MKLVKSCLRNDGNVNYERVLETSTNIYFYPMGDHKGRSLFGRKYDRRMNLLNEGIDIDTEIFEIFTKEKYNWVSKKFENKFAIFK